MAAKRKPRARIEDELERCTALPLEYLAHRSSRGERIKLDFGSSMRAKAPTLEELDRR